MRPPREVADRSPAGGAWAWHAYTGVAADHCRVLLADDRGGDPTTYAASMGAQAQALEHSGDAGMIEALLARIDA
jgi:hypothetical protein